MHWNTTLIRLIQNDPLLRNLNVGQVTLFSTNEEEVEKVSQMAHPPSSIAFKFTLVARDCS